MAEIIVLGSIALGAVFVLVWLLRPDVRAWLEQPKHRFQDETRRYDRASRHEPDDRVTGVNLDTPSR